MPNSADAEHIVLVGAGHTHLHILQCWRKKPLSGARLTLITADETAVYSGMISGVIAGQYTPEEAQIPLRPLAESCGVELVVEPAAGLRCRPQEVVLSSGRTIPFDIASVGLGSVPSQRKIWEAVPGVVPVKPILTLAQRIDAAVETALQQRRQRGEELPLSVAVVGGGATGIELTLCLQKRLERHNVGISLLLIEAGAQILPGYRTATRERIEREFIRRGILTRLNQRVVSLHPSESAERRGVEMELSTGDRLVPHMVLWTTGAAPPPVLQQFELPKSERGFLEIGPTLQSTANVPVFAVGDTADRQDCTVPKAGVYAVREGPVLWDNLQRMLRGKPLREYRPQKRFLSLLNTGDERAVLEYKACTSHSRWAWKLKDRIDRRFLERYRV